MSAVLRAVFRMSAATALSRVTGYLRTMTVAATLGTGAVAGAYTLSNALPTQIYELFVGGVLSSIFVPILVGRLTRHGAEDARGLTGALMTLVLPLLAALAVLGIVFARPLILLTTGWTDSALLSPEEAARRTDLAVLMFRFFALQILFYGAGSLATGVLNAHRRFFLPTFAPVLNNVVVMLSLGAYALLAGRSPTAAVYTLAAGTTLGVALMSLVLVPPALRLGYRPRPRLYHPALRPAARLAAPVLLFVGATVGVQVFSNLLASRFDGVDELYYAFTVFLLPYGIFVVAIATALTPELSEKHARGDAAGYRETLSFGLRTTLFVVAPAVAGLAALSTPIVGLLYERGAFGPADTAGVAALLTAYAAGLPGYALHFVLVRAFYARQNTLAPALLNAGNLALFAALAYLLSGTAGFVGIPVAFSAAYTVLAAALFLALRREVKRIPVRRLAASAAKIAVAGAGMYAAARTGLFLFGGGPGFADRVLVVSLIGGASLAVYLGIAFLLRAEELEAVAGWSRSIPFLR